MPAYGFTFRQPNNGMPTLPVLNAPAPAGGAGQDRANIDSLLRGEFDPYEINMQSAEKAVGSGTGGSGFAQAGRYKLLDSEKLRRQQLGHEELDPYLNREHQAALQAEGEAARLREIAAQGEQAMQQLQASQSGRMAELSQQEKAQLEYLAQQGSQAMDQLKQQQSGNRDITGMNIGGNIVTSLIGRLGSSGGGSGRGSGPAQELGRNDVSSQVGLGAGALEYNGAKSGDLGLRGYTPTPRAPFISGGGDRNVNTLINDILKKYGFNSLKL